MMWSIRFVTTMRSVLIALVCIVAVGGCELPPPESTQQGFRGTGMVQVDGPEHKADVMNRQIVPAATPALPGGGPVANQVYQNVKVLGNLSVGQFARLMAAMTEWVAPEQGCTYCHETDMASDEKYQKRVSRRMLQMTRHINRYWDNHVAETGVTCYTCHRGKNVPEYLWFAGGSESGIPETRGMATRRGGQNLANASVGQTSMTSDPFTSLLVGDRNLRVASTTALPAGLTDTIQGTENTYALMMHMSESLGVNCTFCHNSRAFAAWPESRPQRTIAYHGIQMVKDVNNTHLNPLLPEYPSNRLGPSGDAPKVFCATCHQGLNKPLGGAPMLKDYPSLGAGKK